jgi:hypothetical protein
MHTIMSQNIFINPLHQARFLQDGYVVLDLLSEQDIHELQRAFTEVEQRHQFDFVASVLIPDADLRRSIHRSVAPVFERSLLPMLDRYKVVLGNFAAKRASSALGKMPLHQDNTFVEEGERTGITLWCPLVDVGEHNGWLGVVPGSQHLDNPYRDPCPLPYPQYVDVIESDYLQYLPMRAGQALFMDNRLIHGSTPNLSGMMRPVAAGVAIPAESPLLCCYAEETTEAGTVHVYQVPDDFYLRHAMRTEPKEGQLYKTVPRSIEALTTEKMESIFHA